MKKLLAILLTLAMVMSMAVVVSADDTVLYTFTKNLGQENYEKALNEVPLTGNVYENKFATNWKNSTEWNKFITAINTENAVLTITYTDGSVSAVYIQGSAATESCAVTADNGTATVACSDFTTACANALASGQSYYNFMIAGTEGTKITSITVAVPDTTTDSPVTIGTAGYDTLAAAMAVVKDGETITVNEAGTYTLGSNANNISYTITAAVDGVVIANVGSHATRADITFNNVTFDYTSNNNYVGLQHSGDMVYNNCTFNGKVFLYGTSEIFNNCTFVQTVEDYNVWTYGAVDVDFNNCTFNCAGKSVLIYNEGVTANQTVDFTNCTFTASAAVEGKAAIEIDTSLKTADYTTIVNIDSDTTATGFGEGSVSGNSLWNDKKNNPVDGNITVNVGNTHVWPVYSPKFQGIGVVFTSDPGIRINFEIECEEAYTAESLTIKLYDENGNLLTQAYRNPNRAADDGLLHFGTITTGFVMMKPTTVDDNPGWLQTAWTLDASNPPAYAELWVDGVKVDTTGIKEYDWESSEANGYKYAGNIPTTETPVNTGYFSTGDETHAVIINGAIITSNHVFNANGDCVFCGHHVDVEEEEIVVEVPVEAGGEEVDTDDVDNNEDETVDVEDKTEDTNPTTGIALAVVPMMVAAAAVVASKRR